MMQRSIGTRLTAIFIGLAVVPLVLVGIIVGTQGFRQQQQQAIEEQSQTAQTIAGSVETFLDGLERRLELVINVQGLQGASLDQQEVLLASLLANEFIFDQLILLDATGDSTVIQTRLSIQPSTIDDALFTQISEGGETYYSSVYFDTLTGEPLMTIGLPFEDRDGTLEGVLVAEARVKTIWDLIRELRVQPGEIIYITDEANRIIAHSSEPVVVLRNTQFDPPEVGGIQTGLDGSEVVMATERLTIGEQTFTIVVERTTAETLAPAYDALRVVGVAVAAASIAAVAFGVVAVRQIVRPIEELADAAQSMREGDLSTAIEVDTEDEIGELAESLRQMSDQLQESITTLEQRVASRTSDLRVAAEVSREITTELDIDKVMQKVVTLTASRFNLDACFIFLPEGDELVSAVGADGQGQPLELDRRVAIASKPSMIALAARTLDIVIEKDVRDSENFLSEETLPDIRSELAIPMMLGGHLLGIFDVQSQNVDHFDADDRRVLITLSEQVAVALRNAQLFEQAQEARRAAEQANKIKSQFLANMSHELRTPLNAILNMTRFVSTGMMGDVNEEQVETLDEVVESGEHLLSLINDVLDISKIEAGALKLFIEEDLMLSEVLEGIEPSARTLLAGKPVTLETSIADDVPAITGDARRIRQIMLNLVSNACKFTDEGHVAVRVRRNGSDEVYLEIEDTGPGIAPEEEELIFEIFSQTSVGAQQGGGTGLGMAITKRLVEAHQGRIWFESEVGQGTTFTVALPIEGSE